MAITRCDPLGVARPVGPISYNGCRTCDGSGNINNPYTFAPFQCDGSGNPIAPNSDGSQNAGANCNKIPRAMFDPAVNPSVDPSGLAMIKLYPQTNVSQHVDADQLLECAGEERSTKASSTSGWITIFPARIRYLPASATIRPTRSFPGARRVRGSQALSPALKTSPITGAMSRFRKRTSSTIAISTSSRSASTGSLITSCHSGTAPAKPPTSAFWARI